MKQVGAPEPNSTSLENSLQVGLTNMQNTKNVRFSWRIQMAEATLQSMKKPK